MGDAPSHRPLEQHLRGLSAAPEASVADAVVARATLERRLDPLRAVAITLAFAAWAWAVQEIVTIAIDALQLTF